MLYAQTVFGLAIEGPFDYLIPESLSEKIKPGARVWVNFRTRRILGYVVKLTQQTKIKHLKPILEVIDTLPVLNKNMLLVTKELSGYYCCSWGQAIEAALPGDLRNGKRIERIEEGKTIDNIDSKEKDALEIDLIHDIDNYARWDIYLHRIKEALASQKSVIFLLPDINSVLRARERIIFDLNIAPGLLYRKQPRELQEWLKIKEGKVNIVLGTRSAIFAPLNNLGLVIIEEENDPVYKQEQVPHYHAREIAFMRSNIEKARVILASTLPSLESFYLTKKNKNIKYTFIPRKRDYPEIKIIDTKHSLPLARRKITHISKYLEDSIARSLGVKEKILLFLNRRGFATFASCRYCGIVLKCPRCNINLVYYFKENILNCHYCNFKMPAPTICLNCNSGYIRYSGIGTEKIESELSRLFPQAGIRRFDDDKDTNVNADIFVSTQSIFKQAGYHFDLVGVLAIDNSLNRIDFRSGERVFLLLVGLLGLAEKRLIIQTSLANHHCFRALLGNKNIPLFYDEELKQRKQLNFPPYSHIGLVKLRGKQENKVKEISNALFQRLNRYNQNKKLRIISVNPGQPAKLRGKFCWQILLSSQSAKKISNFLKIYLKDFSHSGIIITVDIDPC